MSSAGGINVTPVLEVSTMERYEKAGQGGGSGAPRSPTDRNIAPMSGAAGADFQVEATYHPPAERQRPHPRAAQLRKHPTQRAGAER